MTIVVSIGRLKAVARLKRCDCGVAVRSSTPHFLIFPKSLIALFCQGFELFGFVPKFIILEGQKKLKIRVFPKTIVKNDPCYLFMLIYVCVSNALSKKMHTVQGQISVS